MCLYARKLDRYWPKRPRQLNRSKWAIHSKVTEQAVSCLYASKKLQWNSQSVQQNRTETIHRQNVRAYEIKFGRSRKFASLVRQFFTDPVLWNDQTTKVRVRHSATNVRLERPKCKVPKFLESFFFLAAFVNAVSFQSDSRMSPQLHSNEIWRVIIMC